MSRLTVDSITDDHILRFGRSRRDGTINDATCRMMCRVALGIAAPTITPLEVRDARAWIADAINRGDQ